MATTESQSVFPAKVFFFLSSFFACLRGVPMPSDVITAVEEEEGGGVFRERKGDPLPHQRKKKTIGAFSLYDRYSNEKKRSTNFLDLHPIREKELGSAAAE